jgi:hypothetical protein
VREKVIVGTPNLDAAVSRIRMRQRRALCDPGGRLVIVPFLVPVFAVLYQLPDVTGRLLAWHIQPTLTAMLLGPAYLGGAYFFLRAVRPGRRRHWLMRGLVKPAVEGG